MPAAWEQNRDVLFSQKQLRLTKWNHTMAETFPGAWLLQQDPMKHDRTILPCHMVKVVLPNTLMTKGIQTKLESSAIPGRA